MNALNHAVIATDPEGHITYWNRPAEELYGWREEEVKGKNITSVTPAGISREDAKRIMDSLAAGEPWSGIFAVRNRAGAKFSVCVTDLPMLDEQRQVIGVVGVSSPVAPPSPVAEVLRRFAATASDVWPDTIHSNIHGLHDRRALVPDPHLLHLLSLLLLREKESLQSSAVVDIEAEERGGQVCVRIASRSADKGTSLASPYAAQLVRMAGGRLFTQERGGAHLFLPTATR